MPYDQWLPKCHELNDRIVSAFKRRSEQLEGSLGSARSQALQHRYQEALIYTIAAANISSCYLSAVIQQLDVMMEKERVSGPQDTQGQKIDDLGAGLALASIENLVTVVEISNFDRIVSVLKTLVQLVSSAAIPPLEWVYAAQKIIDALAAPLSETDRRLLELEAYEFAALHAATWAVGQAVAFVGPPDGRLDKPLDEAVKEAAAAARKIVDAEVLKVRTNFSEEINKVAETPS